MVPITRKSLVFGQTPRQRQEEPISEKQAVCDGLPPKAEQDLLHQTGAGNQDLVIFVPSYWPPAAILVFIPGFNDSRFNWTVLLPVVFNASGHYALRSTNALVEHSAASDSTSLLLGWPHVPISSQKLAT